MLRRACLATLLLVFAMPNAGAAGDKEMLRGLRSIAVMLAPLGPDAEADGIVRLQLQTDMDTQMRRVGLQLTNRPEALLVATVLTTSRGTDHAYVVTLELTENATMYRTQKLVSVTTWSANFAVGFGVAPAAQLGQAVRDALTEELDEFVTDYLAVNPVVLTNTK